MMLSFFSISAVLQDLKLRTKVPIDNEGRVRFPQIDLNDASRSQLQLIYEDFMAAIWCKDRLLVLRSLLIYS